ncbi:MAG: hypothetical protein ACXWZS_09975 [Gemmatirosa sp.]
MKKRSARDIPDFAHHPTHMQDGQRVAAPLPARAEEGGGHHRPASRETAAAPTRVKPHATSQKSGRRGQ